MEMEENYGQQNTATLTADDERQSTPPVASLSDDFRHSPPTTPDRKKSHSFNTNEVASIFHRSGLPRSHRSIERYCKEGKLDSFFDTDEQRHYVTPESVERLIGQLKEIQARQQATTPSADTLRPDAPPSPTSSATVADTAPTPKTKELEAQIQTLEIDKRVRDQIIDNLKEQIREDRQHFTTRLEDNARRVGELQTRLLRLESPRRQPEAVEDAQTTEPHANASYSGSDDELTG